MLAPLVVLAAAGLASAHFGIEYPVWRADSLNNESYSQYTFPCKLSSCTALLYPAHV